jgi:GNAT superfamily N-acetyltransferase
MQVRPVDVHDDAQMRRFHEIGWRGEMEDGRPWNAFWTYDEMAAMFRKPTPGQIHEAHGIFDGDDPEEMVGGGVLFAGTDDNLDKAIVVPVVEPDRRGRGIGGALLEGLVERARELGRTRILSGTSVPFEERESSPVIRFAKAHGFGPDTTEVVRLLSLPTPEGLLEEIEAEVAEHSEGYEVHVHDDGVPDDLIESYCYLVNQLVVDAPSGEVDWEAETLTPDAVRHEVERDRAVGRTVLRALAVKDGEAVAHSDLLIRPSGTRAAQWATLVRRDHRGHRLGAAVKVANIRRLQETRPDITDVVTQNAEVNAQMIGINERLGFRAAALVPEFVRLL